MVIFFLSPLCSLQSPFLSQYCSPTPLMISFHILLANESNNIRNFIQTRFAIYESTKCVTCAQHTHTHTFSNPVNYKLYFVLCFHLPSASGSLSLAHRSLPSISLMHFLFSYMCTLLIFIGWASDDVMLSWVVLLLTSFNISMLKSDRYICT